MSKQHGWFTTRIFWRTYSLSNFCFNQTKRNQIAKIGMMHNSKVGHFGLERTLKRLKNQNDVWQFQRQHIRHFIDECACCQKNEYAESTNSRSWIHDIHLHSHGMSKHRLYWPISWQMIYPCHRMHIHTLGGVIRDCWCYGTIYCRMFTTTFWSLRRTTSVKIG